jgi:asparagine synthase (glutamine-hydrolysing)
LEVGFNVTSNAGSVEFRTFSPLGDGQPKLVTFSQKFGYFTVFMGRLYYRHDLIANLGNSMVERFSENGEPNYATLALAAYCKLGLTGLERLEGDFALVIWDAKERRLVASRDPMGGYPLFWTEHGGTIALGNSIRALLDILPHRSLNLDYMAEFLMVPGQVNERAGERSAYEAVHRVLAGSVVSIHLPSKRIERRTYWDWSERILDPETDILKEVSEQYRDLLRHAVRERIDGRTVSHLSGGMDSTALSLIARDWVRSGVGEAPLHTISLVYEQLPNLSLEMPYLESVLHREKEIVAHCIPADDLLDFDSFADPPFHDEPYVGLWRLGMDRATVDTAADLGAATMLTGIGADEILDVQPFYITDLLRQGRLRTAWKEACRWALADNCSPWGILGPFGISNLFPTFPSSRLGRALPTSTRGGLGSQDDWTIPPWILPDFARRHDLRSHAAKNARQTYRSCGKTGLSFVLHSIQSRVGDVNRWSVAAPQGVFVANPFLDARVLRFGLGVHDRLTPEPGRMKPILAEAMRDTLPDNIRTRRRKGQFNEVYYLGLARNQHKLEAMIWQTPLEDLGIFD